MVVRRCRNGCGPLLRDVETMTDPMSLGSDEPHPLADQFIAELAAMTDPHVIEFGTKRWDPNLATHHKGWAPHAPLYVMADIEYGEDVDLVLDVHDLDYIHEGRPCGPLHAVICIAVLEHCKRPWIAFREMARILRPGGIGYFQTHQSFVLHGEDGSYGGDYWRFSRAALTLLAEDAGLEVIGTSYTHPVKLIPQTSIARWNDSPDVEAYLCVDLLARKP